MDKDFFEAFKCFEPKNKHRESTDSRNSGSGEAVAPIITEEESSLYIACDINDKLPLTPVRLHSDVSESVEEKLDIKSCKSMERISQILTYYISWIKQIESSLDDIDINDSEIQITPPSIGMFDIINSKKYLGNYNNSQLINDFHHIIHEHQFKTIYQIFTLYYKSANHCIKCKSSKGDGICKLLKRNYRSRDKNYHNNLYRQRLYYGYNLSTEITTQQILDYIHCYIYHSYDLGLKFTSKQTKMLNDHLDLYKQQLLDYDHNIMEFSKTLTPTGELKEDQLSPPKLGNTKRGSMIYNQKIEHSVQSIEASNNSSESDTDDSLSRTPQPDEEETKSDIKLSPSLPPQPSPQKLKQAYKKAANNLNASSSATPMMLTPSHPLPNTSKNIREKQNDNDSKLIKKIKLSNSKITILRQIIKQNKLNKTLKKLQNGDGKDSNHNHKFVHILSSYRHLQPESIIKQKSDDSKSNTNATASGDQKENDKDITIQIKEIPKTKTRHRQSSSAEQPIIMKPKPKDDTYVLHSLLVSLVLFTCLLYVFLYSSIILAHFINVIQIDEGFRSSR